VEEDGVDICFGSGARGGGYYLAFFVSDDVVAKKKPHP